MKKIIAYHIALIIIVMGFGLGMNSCALSTGSTTNNVTNFTLVASWTGSVGEVINSVYAEGTNIYAAAGSDGLYIFNSGLTYLTKFSTNSLIIKDVVVKTCFSVKYAFLAYGLSDGMGGTAMVSVNDLTNFIVTNACSFSNRSPNAIVVNDDLTNIYSADQCIGFENYTNGWNSGATSTNKFTILNAPGADIAVSGARTYLAAKTSGVYVLDHTVNSGILANVNSTLNIANAVAVSGGGNGTLLAVGDNLGLIVFNMDSPDSPITPRYLGGYYGTPVYDIAIDGNDFYLALGTAGIVKLTRTPPATFTLMKQYSDGAAYYKIFYFSTTGNLYAAAGKDGIRILR